MRQKLKIKRPQVASALCAMFLIKLCKLKHNLICIVKAVQGFSDKKSSATSGTAARKSN